MTAPSPESGTSPLCPHGPEDFHCATHGWWNPKREAGCPDCMTEARRKVRTLERALAESQGRERELREALQMTDPMSELEATLTREQVEELRNQIGNEFDDAVTLTARHMHALCDLALAQLSAQAREVAGFVRVPIEPTLAMLSIDAPHGDMDEREGEPLNWKFRRAIYRAMLTASPTAPSGQERGERRKGQRRVKDTPSVEDGNLLRRIGLDDRRKPETKA